VVATVTFLDSNGSFESSGSVMVAVEAGKAEEVKIPENVALLPFEEKAKLIVALRRQGKTYREIQMLLRVSPRDVKRALKIEAHKDEVEELKGRMGQLEGKLSNIEKALAELQGFKAEVLELKGWLERGLNMRFRQDLKDENCVHMVGGFCENWFWKEPVKGWSMKRGREGYNLNVERHRWMCLACPSFTPKSLAERLDEITKQVGKINKMLEMILARSSS